jgi:uncharacterized membrane protein YdjX (TVP38/TMEM64 family)
MKGRQNTVTWGVPERQRVRPRILFLAPVTAPFMPPDNDKAPQDGLGGGRNGGIPWRRVLPLAIVLVAAAVIYMLGWHRQVSLQAVIRHREAIEGLIASRYPVAIAAYLAAYIVVVALSLPGGAVMSMIGGFLFGWLVGGLTAIVGATVGATTIFLIARSAIGEYLLRRAGPLACRLATGFRNDAFGYLMFLRLSPVPFWIVNIVPALANIPLRTFFTATLIGIIPATFIFAFIGAGLDNAIAGQAAAYRACLSDGRSDCRLDFDLHAALSGKLLLALGALCLLALIPIAVRRWRAHLRRRNA